MQDKDVQALQAAGKNPVVLMKTSFGDVTIELFAAKAPITVANFLRYVDSGYYNGTIFHRVISHFMVQGGGMLPGMKEKETRAPIKNEADNGVQNTRGTIAMARTGIVDSATSQFFINVVDNYFLNHRDKSVQGYGYCAFGQVTKGMDVVDKIREVETTSVGPHGDVPKNDVVIISITRVAP